MGINFNELKSLIGQVNIGRQINIYNSNITPYWNQISSGQMAWVEGAVLYCDISA
ncbi:MAG: hypothetical protein HeimC3_39520 [Candidatus Heimdallarchaeota archaeon LC_3]|nr:MAG: hypothetical protein HeimC3_39520 [Candidatus Heimdallarchaeota archaeon LC_3]